MPRPVCPPIAADVIAEIDDRIVLIERKNFPLGWALPGGFVDVGETVEHAAVRELMEETSLTVELRALLGVYSKPERDPRGQTVTVVYVGRAQGTPEACDDAKGIGLSADRAADSAGVRSCGDTCRLLALPEERSIPDALAKH